ncbi:MAG: prepilin-type N-terminal cleavage/methylation domain-containing protein [Terricaulis sp.]
MRRAHEAGFSVIETLVAVAILAIALIPILMIQTQTSRASLRETAARSAITDQQNALAALRDINPMQQPSGSIVLSDDRAITWRATPLSPVTQTLARAGAQTSFDAALYRLNVEVQDKHGTRLQSFLLDQMGWRARAAPQQ